MDEITIELIIKALYFIAAGFLSMVYAFSHQWMTSNDSRRLDQYLLGDKRKVGLSTSILLTSCAAAGQFDYLAANSVEQLVGLGIMIGAGVPIKLKSKLTEPETENKG